MEDSEDSSDDSDAEQWENLDVKVGSMELVRQTLEGISRSNKDEGVKALGRHARTIRLGRSLALPARTIVSCIRLNGGHATM